ncbi:MAG: hypothetical protein ACOYD0_07195 [Candidatus Nanopelagicales bacterium]
MSPLEADRRKSSPVVVVAVGAKAEETRDELLATQQGLVVGIDAARGGKADVAAVVNKLRELRPAAGEPASVPAVLITAATSDCQDVLSMLVALRQLEPDLRPRVWPAFVAGDAGELEAFDLALDEAGSGLCDLALVTIGAPSVSAATQALGAWVQIKAPAPASVLGELPDAQGRICRYVALGAQSVESIGKASVGLDSAEGPTSGSSDPVTSTEVESVAADVQRRLCECAKEAQELAAAIAAGAEIGDAGERADTAAVLRADAQLSSSLESLRREAGRSLRLELADLIDAAIADNAKVAEPAATTDSGASSGAAPADAESGHDEKSAADPVGEPADTASGDSSTDTAGSVGSAAAPALSRTDAVAALAMLTSKGGLAKMFGRSRMAAAAQAATLAANREIDDQLDRLVGDVGAGLAEQVRAKLTENRQRDRNEQARRAMSEQAEQALQLDASVAQATRDVQIWPTVDTAGVRRSWGGSAPAARRYVVKSADPSSEISESDGILTVIDLRDPAPHSDMGRPAAVVLLAQYGLPLSALTA